MKTRPLREEDIGAVVGLERLCNPMPWNEKALKPFALEAAADPSRMARVAGEDGGPLLGYVCASVAGEEAEILILGVAPSARRRGLGRALLSDLCAGLRALDCRSLFLELRKSNAPALALYRAAGFRETGVRKGYYADAGEDAVLMRRDL